MFSQLKKTYLSLPEFVKRPVKHLPYPWVAGKNYRTTLAECRRVEQLSRAEISALQEERLGETLQFAVEEVPFYRPYRNAVGRYKPGEAIREFPLLAKADVQENFEQLKPRCLQSIPHHSTTTGGSSGNQLTFLEDDATYAREMGFMHAQWRRVGYWPGCRKAAFRGVLFPRIGKGVYWQENPIHNEIQFSPFHMDEATMALYVDKLIAYKPEYLHGYASAIDLLAEYALRHQLGDFMPQLKAVLLSSEAASAEQRRRISQAFGRRIYTWYGQSERVALAGECEHSENYHAFPNYSHLELIQDNGEYAGAGERGEIVGTGFLNRSLPLIRYRTDDTAVKVGEPCACGREWVLIKDVIGRNSMEFIYNRHGAKFTTTALNMHSDMFKSVIRFQYYQETPGELVVRVMPNEFFSAQDEAKIIQEHREKVGDAMNVTVERVEMIPLLANGKYKRLICRVNA